MAKTFAQARRSLAKKLKAMPPEVRAEVRKAIKAGADRTTAQQKRLAPRRSGDLQASIKNAMGDEDAAAYALLGKRGRTGDRELTAIMTAGDKKAFYARSVEFGTAPHINAGRFAGTEHPGAQARPFFFPAYRANRKAVRSAMVRAGTKALRRAAKK